MQAWNTALRTAMGEVQYQPPPPPFAVSPPARAATPSSSPGPRPPPPPPFPAPPASPHAPGQSSSSPPLSSSSSSSSSCVCLHVRPRTQGRLDAAACLAGGAGGKGGAGGGLSGVGMKGRGVGGWVDRAELAVVWRKGERANELNCAVPDEWRGKREKTEDELCAVRQSVCAAAPAAK